MIVEQRLGGTEVYWAAWQQDLVTQPRLSSCPGLTRSYIERVQRAYASTAVIEGTTSLAAFLRDKDEDFREELSGEPKSLSQIFAEQQQAVIDLQAFVDDQGGMAVFDPAGLNNQTKFVTTTARARDRVWGS